MTKVANEFQVGVTGNVGGCVKFTSKAMTYNGKKGRIWTKWIQQEGGAWLHDGNNHVRTDAAEEEVMAAFDDQK